MKAEQHLHEQPLEQFLYANVLHWSTRIGLLVLVLTFGAYMFGVTNPHVPPERLPGLWSQPVASYLQQTHMSAGWGWLARLREGEGAGLLGIAILAGTSIACLLALVPLYVRRGDGAFATLCVVEVLVILVAASGWLAGGA